MSMIDFTRGELSPWLRYRSDLEVYHKGVEELENFLPVPSGGLIRRPGSQVLELLYDSDTPPAVRLFSLGATGFDFDIPAPSEDSTVDIGDATYTTDNRIHDIPKDDEIEIILAFTEYGEDDDIIAYWINTPTRIPAFYQRIWNYDEDDEEYLRPEIDFDDTRSVRVVQVENSVYIISKTQIYRLYWDREKVTPTWDSGTTYEERDVVKAAVGTTYYYFECIEENTNNDPTDEGSQAFWRITYCPYLSWEIVSPRVGHELLSGIGTTEDPYEYNTNKTWASDTEYKKGDVVLFDSKVFECHEAMTTENIGTKTPAHEDYSDYWTDLTTDHPISPADDIADEDRIYKRSTFAFREEAVPREMVVHHNRLIFAGSSIRPSTIHGSEVAHYLNFGAGENDNEPWIFTLSGDRVGRVLWMTVTDQLYLGTSGGVYAVSGVITPNQFMLRKVTSHAASTIKGVTAGGSIIFFHQDKKTLREVEYADQAENYQALNLTVYSDHLFEDYDAIKLVVVNDPQVIIWILRADGTLVSLSYEKTVGMYAFARHELHGFIYDIVPTKANELFGVLKTNEGVNQLIRIGDISLVGDEDEEDTTTLKDFCLDGLMTFVNTDTTNEFKAYIANESFFDWLIENGFSTITDMFDWTLAVDASDEDLDGKIEDCGLNYLDEIPSLDLSDNSLEGTIKSNLTNLMSNYAGAAEINLSGNPITNWDLDEVPDTWTVINLANTSFSQGQTKKIIDSVYDSQATTPRNGTLDLTGLGVIESGYGLEELVSLKGDGWTITIDNAAGWDSEQVSFSGNENDSGSPPSAMSCLYMAEITLPDENTLEKTDHDFIGWSENSDSGSAEYVPGSTYKKTSESNVTLYAIWIPANGVNYNGNGSDGGSVPVDGNTYNPGDTVTVESNTMTRTGHTFQYWTTDQAGNNAPLYPGDTFEMGSSAVVLYAQWSINSYTLTFNSNDSYKGTSPSSMTVDYQEQATVPAPTTTLFKRVSYSSGYRHYIFDKWNTQSDGSGTDYEVGSSYLMPAQDVTLYAKYRDFELGDEAPFSDGCVVVYDYGSYKNRHFPYQDDDETLYVRYITAMPEDIAYTYGDTYQASETYVDWNGDYYYCLPSKDMLLEVLTSGHVPNLDRPEYWTGCFRIDVILWWSVKYAYYITVSDSTIRKEEDYKSIKKGVRLFKGF